ncbi:MAG TPA: hypothetical protein VGH33_04415 [Isosphaeraceae bacterium]|jgi:hypothetical protein
MSRTACSLGIAVAVLGLTDRGAGAARAQLPGREVVYETVVPGPPVVAYGERYKVRYRPRRIVVKERPFVYVAPSAPVVTETRLIQPAPIVERRIVQPAPIVESRIIQPAPVFETRYYGPYPY